MRREVGPIGVVQSLGAALEANNGDEEERDGLLKEAIAQLDQLGNVVHECTRLIESGRLDADGGTLRIQAFVARLENSEAFVQEFDGARSPVAEDETLAATVSTYIESLQGCLVEFAAGTRQLGLAELSMDCLRLYVRAEGVRQSFLGPASNPAALRDRLLPGLVSWLAMVRLNADEYSGYRQGYREFSDLARLLLGEGGYSQSEAIIVEEFLESGTYG